MNVIEIMQNIVFPCCQGGSLLSGRPAFEGVDAYFCAKEIFEMLEKKMLIFHIETHPSFQNHKDGISIVVRWSADQCTCLCR